MNLPFNYKQKLFIYQRREMMVLVPLGLMITLFAFTLGVHLGKEVVRAPLTQKEEEPSLVTTLPDRLPNPEDLTEPAKGAQVLIEGSLNQELHDEVTKTGIKLQKKTQTDLPEKPKKPEAGATTLESKAEKYTLQIASFPTAAEAKKRLALLKKSDLDAFLQEIHASNHSKWYRIYLGRFASRPAAEEAGQRYRSKHMIASFLVTKLKD